MCIRTATCFFDLDPIRSGSREAGLQFPIASVTKTFTAALCLEPEARQNLDQPFGKIMSFFQMNNPEATRKMTPRHALCHLSGLNPQTASWVTNPQSRRDFVIHRLPEFACAADWQEKHRYSNVMYAVLGLWLEERTGKPWETLIRERIQHPLHLKSLEFLEPGWEQHCPPPFELRDGKAVNIPPFYSRKGHLIAPASEIRMTLGDLARWGQFQLSLDPEDERWQPHSFVTDQRPFPDFGPLHYGLGWRLDTVRGERRVWHSGQCSGYSSLLSLYPEKGFGFAAAVNCSASVKQLHALDLQNFTEITS